MKKTPRVWQLLFLLLLVAIVWPGGSDAGVAMEVRSATQKPLPPGSPNIISFDVTPATVLKGAAAVLRWQVSNAEHIWISRGAGPANSECVKEATGEMRVTPDRDTTYTLNVWAGSIQISRPVTVQVRQPSGVCTISGMVDKNKSDYKTKVELYVEGSARPMLTTGVDGAGFYGFSSVPEGKYRVMVRGRFPPDRFSIGPIPRSIDVTCEPNRSTPNPANFRIGSTEG